MTSPGLQISDRDCGLDTENRQITGVLNLLVIAGVVLCMAGQLHLAFSQVINWDEFYFLEFIYRYLDGSLTKPLQTLHVHIFSWLAHTGRNEIDQIIERTRRVLDLTLEDPDVRASMA